MRFAKTDRRLSFQNMHMARFMQTASSPIDSSTPMDCTSEWDESINKET
jgi:hypothetical protein